MSHLLQMRGLKQKRYCAQNQILLSHLLQMRGLKLNWLHQAGSGKNVASFTDAWIETSEKLFS